MITELVARAGSRLVVLAGAGLLSSRFFLQRQHSSLKFTHFADTGLRPENVGPLIEETRVKEVHGTFREQVRAAKAEAVNCCCCCCCCFF